ncbi:Late embryogenesis abundant protein [Parasponia andersonii]|uniref:Late embryogenesis abundant protein n=1 Tax=Parasponia andersonii TaxID=3476 RepID=A0A2P5C2V0_PARAD|nr:Late embryogenesis abundant protein [Parasponia andersonii]
MAPTQQPQKTTVTKPPRQRAHILRWAAMLFLALIVLVGIAVLIIWLVIKPKRLVFSVEDGSVYNFNISNDNHLNASFNFVVRSYNPNSRVSIYYDSIESRVDYDDQSLAFSVVDSFFQPHWNVTRLQVKLEAQSTALLGSVSKDIKLEKSSGEMELDLWLKAKIRFKVGAWKSSHRTLKVSCSPVVVHFSRPKAFNRALCDVEL